METEGLGEEESASGSQKLNDGNPADDRKGSDNVVPIEPPQPEPPKFIRVSCNLSAEIYEKVLKEFTDRKLAGRPNASITGVLVDALEAFFSSRGSPAPPSAPADATKNGSTSENIVGG